MAIYTLNVYYEHTRYQVTTDVCPTWRKVVASVLAARKEGDDLGSFKVRTPVGKYLNLDAATDVGWEGVPSISLFLEHKDRPEARFAPTTA